MPRAFCHLSGTMSIGPLHGFGRPDRTDQFRIRSLIIPKVAVRMPCSILELQNLSFQRPGRIALGSRNRKMLREDSSLRVRSTNCAMRSQLDCFFPGNSDKALRDRAVDPARNRDVVGHDSRGRLQSRQIGKDSCLTEQFWKLGGQIFHLVRQQLINLPSKVIVENVKLSG